MTRPSFIKDSVLCFLQEKRDRLNSLCLYPCIILKKGNNNKSKKYSRVKDQSGYVFLGHTGKLMREDILEANEPHQDPLVRLLIERVPDDVKFDHPSPLFKAGSFITSGMSGEQRGLTRTESCKISMILLLP